ncbi:colicin immunity domain-containing protein [Xenorhabdus ishibashii]|uniref:Colicin immunity protein n=1 Tax=Xenorhabdus ishibashii TaxID=1034471 RepID=A0A2D0KHP8_9GAMM|nr:colicin immunity domain-containing protein [Xenorhabdus ishibashii]PHM62970.1 colicin immunity protein [Xenorhabdus ishibashii]
MSLKLINLAKYFCAHDIDADEFTDRYISLWMDERDNNQLVIDGKKVDEVSSSIFCFADMYNPDSDRRPSEFDENELRLKVKSILHKYNLD